MRRVIVMGGCGREFHDFNVVFRDDPDVDVVAFTTDEVVDGDERRYPASLAGPRYPNGIPIRPESELASLIEGEWADEVVLCTSDLSHAAVVHRASIALAAGADFRLLGPNATMLQSTKPVVAVCAGAGKSQTSRRIGELLLDAGLRVALIRRPVPHGDLEALRVQRFATLAELDASRPMIQELEGPLERGLVVYAGVDDAAVLARAEHEADVIVWDGGDSDVPFFRPDLLITVVDPLRVAHERGYYPGEANLRMADVVLVNTIDSADAASIDRVLVDVAALNPSATVTHGGMPSGAGIADVLAPVIERARTGALAVAR